MDNLFRMPAQLSVMKQKVSADVFVKMAKGTLADPLKFTSMLITFIVLLFMGYKKLGTKEI